MWPNAQIPAEGAKNRRARGNLGQSWGPENSLLELLVEIGRVGHFQELFAKNDLLEIFGVGRVGEDLRRSHEIVLDFEKKSERREPARTVFAVDR